MGNIRKHLIPLLEKHVGVMKDNIHLDSYSFMEFNEHILVFMYCTNAVYGKMHINVDLHSEKVINYETLAIDIMLQLNNKIIQLIKDQI